MNKVCSIDGLRQGGKRALSNALGLVEQASDNLDVIKLLDEAFASPRAHVVGFTGPPGVGKSTLINGLISSWRALGQTVGVIAVDPSSQISGGALLGDRTRMITDPDDQGVYVRSLASRGQLGGVAALTFPSLVLMRALYDIVIIETVGVGQSEAEITAHADTVVLCVQPGSGDSLQFMKSGIMEIPDIAVVTKADMGAPARRALSDLKGALSLTQAVADKEPVVLSLSAAQREGLDDLIGAIKARHDEMVVDGSLEDGRQGQAALWIKGALCRDYGLKGFLLVESELNFDVFGPFGLLNSLEKRLVVSLTD